MKRWLWVPVLAAAAGCNSLHRIKEETYERMMLPLMTDVQKAEYYQCPTWTERKTYLYRNDLIQRFELAPPPIRQAILQQRVIKGMSPEQVMMSWGIPDKRVALTPNDDPDVARQEGRKERWYYGLQLTRDLSGRYRRAIEFTNDVVLYVLDDRPKRRVLGAGPGAP